MTDLRFFINSRPRTGGTLLATMLNAHTQISMGYEIYPNLLQDSDGNGYAVDTLMSRLEEARHDDPKTWVRNLERDSFRVFAARARRSGIEPDALIEALQAHAKRGADLATLDQRLDLIDALLRQQAEAAGKPVGGSKMRADLHALHRRHPGAVFLMMLRDGRDVLDSLLHTGNFKTTPEDFACEWQDSLDEFERFLSDSGAKGGLVRYEHLVQTPEAVLTPTLAVAGLAFEPEMVAFHTAPQPLFDNAHGHLSATQLETGLTSSSIGRWKTGLTDDEVDAFLKIAHTTMMAYDYHTKLSSRA